MSGHLGFKEALRLLRWLLGLEYDPAKWAHPAPKRAPKEEKEQPQVQTDYKFKFAHELEGDRRAYFGKDTKLADGAIETIYKRAGQSLTKEFPDELTDRDLFHLRGLKLDKAQIIKPLWVAGLSARKAAETLTDEQGLTGFKQRTVESYFAAFNAVADEQQTPSPEEERGDI